MIILNYQAQQLDLHQVTNFKFFLLLVMSRLIIIPTPIGNLDDITIRAVKVLNRIDILLAEDTRTTKKLLNHLSIKVKTFHIINTMSIKIYKNILI